MRILVTGRDGQVARSLAERGSNFEVVFAARPQFDLCDASSIERTVLETRPDLIVNAAAYTGVDKAEDEPELAMAVNGAAPGILARAAAAINVPIIHLSTDYVFDGSLDRPYRETDSVAPLGVYGASKLAGESAVAGSGARYAILRTAWVYSPFGTNFVRTMLRLATDRDVISVVEDQHGCPTSALDIADAILILAKRWEVEPRHGSDAIYHLCGAGETDWAAFARAIFAESAARGGPTADVKGIPASTYPTRAVRPSNSRLSCEAFADVFGYRAPEWRISLRHVVARLT